MFPTLLDLKFLKIRTYGFFVAIGIMLSYIYIIKKSKNTHFQNLKWDDIFFFIILFGLLGGRITYVAFNLKFYVENPLEVFKIWEGGFVFFGGFLIAFIFTFFYLKKKNIVLLEFADFVSPAIALGHSIGRLGCFSAGCCYGLPTNSKLGIIFTHPETLAIKNIPLFPTQLVESIGLFFIFLLLHFLYKKRKSTGYIFLLYLFLYGIMRFIIEFFRGDERGPILLSFPITQWISLLLFMAALFFLIWKKFLHSKL